MKILKEKDMDAAINLLEEIGRGFLYLIILFVIMLFLELNYKTIHKNDKKCPNCGTKIENADLFCPECSKKMHEKDKIGSDFPWQRFLHKN